MLLTPLEQFQIISLFPVTFLNLDFSFTNSLLMSLLTLIFFNRIVYFFSSETNYIGKEVFYLVPNTWQVFIETIYDTVAQLLFDNINMEGEKYFPYVSMIFLFILFSNLSGLVPYSFTVTSHIIITFALSFSIFIGVNIIGVNKHGFNILSLIIPANSSFMVALILVPIEFLSYLAKPVSLGVRLFINLMAGHTLLKVIVGFAWSMLLLENMVSFMHLIPLIILVVLMVLELAVACIQAYVFTILVCIFLNDSINLH